MRVYKCWIDCYVKRYNDLPISSAIIYPLYLFQEYNATYCTQRPPTASTFDIIDSKLERYIYLQINFNNSIRNMVKQSCYESAINMPAETLKPD